MNPDLVLITGGWATLMIYRAFVNRSILVSVEVANGDWIYNEAGQSQEWLEDVIGSTNPKFVGVEIIKPEKKGKFIKAADEFSSILASRHTVTYGQVCESKIVGDYSNSA